MNFERRAPALEQRGYLLVECLIYIAVLAVVIEVAFSAFYRCLDNSRGLVRNSNDIRRVLDLGERWRVDVRKAVDTPRIVEGDGYTALEIPQVDSLVAYVLADRSIWRKEGDSSPKEVLNGVKAAIFVKDPRANVVCWRCELELTTKKKNVHVRPLFTFEAVPARHRP
jgi:hypothetical protein